MRLSIASDVSYLFLTRSFMNSVFDPEKRFEPPAWQPEQLLANSADPFSKSVAETGDAKDHMSADERHAAPTKKGDEHRCIDMRIWGPCNFKLKVVSAIVSAIIVMKIVLDGETIPLLASVDYFLQLLCTSRLSYTTCWSTSVLLKQLQTSNRSNIQNIWY